LCGILCTNQSKKKKKKKKNPPFDAKSRINTNKKQAASCEHTIFLQTWLIPTGGLTKAELWLVLETIRSTLN
jgi:hypothetical protein